MGYNSVADNTGLSSLV